MFGRHLRQSVSLGAYSYLTYAIAALVLLGITLATGHSWGGYAPVTYLMFVLLAVIPQCIGHTSFNYALKYLPTVSVAIVILAEPVGAALLAWLILDEAVSIATFIGGVVILGGVFLTVYGSEKRNRPNPV